MGNQAFWVGVVFNLSAASTDWIIGEAGGSYVIILGHIDVGRWDPKGEMVM